MSRRAGCFDPPHQNSLVTLVMLSAEPCWAVDLWGVEEKWYVCSTPFVHTVQNVAGGQYLSNSSDRASVV